MAMPVAHTTHVANSTDVKIDAEVKWTGGGHYQEIAPHGYAQVKVPMAQGLVVSLRDLKTKKVITSLPIAPDHSVVVTFVKGQFKICKQRYGGDLFECE